MQDKSPPTVRFPEEIWQNVASRLSLRDWARASGACRTTWNLQLVDVAVTDHDNLGVSGEEQLAQNDPEMFDILCEFVFSRCTAVQIYYQNASLMMLNTPLLLTNH